MTTRPSSPWGNSPPVSCSLSSLHNLAGGIQGCHPNIWSSDFNSQHLNTYNGQQTALQDRCKTRARTTSPSRKSLPNAPPQPLQGGRNPRQTPQIPLRASRSSLEVPSPVQGQRTLQAGVGVGLGRRRHPMDARLRARLLSGLAGGVGRACCHRGSCCSAHAASERSVLGLPQGCTLPVLCSLFLFYCGGTGDFHRGLSSHVTPRSSAGRLRTQRRWPPAEGVGGRRGPSRPARQPRGETPEPRPGVSPRESPGCFGSEGQRHIHVEIAVMGTGNEIGSFFSAVFLQKIINCREQEGK